MKIPQTFITAGSTKLESKIDMGADVAGKGLCPECRTTMEVASVGGNDARICASCRITLPLPNGNTQT